MTKRRSRAEWLPAATPIDDFAFIPQEPLELPPGPLTAKRAYDTSKRLTPEQADALWQRKKRAKKKAE